ncbi:hypothetical protein GOBAR_DD04845 [Gossypium barbadense]|nr:hypothetical protein GOBAR_DD04845 [Gossypium barbadense]
MDLPSFPAAPTVGATSVHLNYPESVESSPRSHNDNTYDDPLPAVPGARLRLMCSFGGHIMPRPHDKSLCYIGGETRIVAVDRHCSLSALCTRLSRALLNGRSFTLKYQLPTEDLDSLVSVSTDEDLENMIEEYDRLIAPSASSATSSRIRLFLFFNKPDTAASMGPLLNDAKSETWFVDALNGSGLVPRGNSDSVTIEALLNIDDGGPKVQDQRVGIEEQFAQISFATNIHKQDDCYGATAVSALPPHLAPTRGGGSSDNLNRILSDDERSDQGVPVGFRKPPLPLQPVQHKACGTYNLPSPDSVASDSSIASANSLSKAMYYQDQTHMSSYYPVYAPPLQQQQLLHHPADQQYPAVYVMPVTQVTQPQPYMSMQSNTGVMTMKSNASDASIMAPTRPLTPPTPSMATVSTAYKETMPPIYPTSTAKPEMAATVYRTAVPSPHQVVQVQQPYVGFSQMQHPPPSPAVTHTANYRYECPNPTQDQMYYAQHQTSQLPPQYQTLTPAAAAAALADASKQLPTDGSNQQIR